MRQKTLDSLLVFAVAAITAVVVFAAIIGTGWATAALALLTASVTTALARKYLLNGPDADIPVGAIRGVWRPEPADDPWDWPRYPPRVAYFVETGIWLPPPRGRARPLAS